MTDDVEVEARLRAVIKDARSIARAMTEHAKELQRQAKKLYEQADGISSTARAFERLADGQDHWRGWGKTKEQARAAIERAYVKVQEAELTDSYPEIMKMYRRHNCKRQHRSYSTLARCIFKSAAWVEGEGEYALVSWCQVPTVTLWPDLEDAERSKQLIDADACGHRCSNRHEVVQLALGMAAGPVTIRRPDGSTEEQPAYSPTRLKQIIGHDRGEERQHGRRAPRQASISRD